MPRSANASATTPATGPVPSVPPSVASIPAARAAASALKPPPTLVEKPVTTASAPGAGTACTR